MSMTKKDYELIAQPIREEIVGWVVASGTNDTNRPEVQALRDVANHIANYLQINPRFNRAKFLEACGISDD